MVDLLVGVAVAVIFGLVFGLGVWLANGLRVAVAARLTPGWRGLALPLSCVMSFGLFLVLRPFLLDQPRTPLWFALGLLAVAALYGGSVALAHTIIEAGKLALSPSGKTGWRLLSGAVIVVLVGLFCVGLVLLVVPHTPDVR